MRVWGREHDPLDSTKWKWVAVETDVNGSNDLPMVTALVQVLRLSLGESPFYASYGIPGRQSVVTQVMPDYYVTLTQQRYAEHFASLIINRRPDERTSILEPPVPTYDIKLVTNQGVQIAASARFAT